MNADGSNQKRLTYSQYGDIEPRFSPDGKTIAFSSNRTARYQVYLMRDDGGNQRRLTHDVAEEYTPTWSPDSKQVAITSNRGGSFEIWIYNVDGSNPRQVTRSGGHFATWSPDGQWIAYSASDGSIRVIHPDGTSERTLYSPINGRASGWLGKRLLVNYAQGDSTDIYAINIDTKDEERLTINALKNQMGGGTPDGRFVVFNSTRNGDDEIYVMNADGSNLRRLTNSLRNDYMPSWGP
jgi:Tol biopolymer transport system component